MTNSNLICCNNQNSLAAGKAYPSPQMFLLCHFIPPTTICLVVWIIFQTAYGTEG